MDATEAHPRLTFHDEVRPPVVVPGDGEVPGILAGIAVVVSDEIAVAMAVGSGRVGAAVVGASGRVVELGPRDCDEIVGMGDVEIAVGAIRDIVMIEPYVIGLALNRDGIIARGTARCRRVARVKRAVADRVADDLDVAKDDVGRPTHPDMSVDLGPAQTHNRLVRADGHSSRYQHALDVDHCSGRALDGTLQGRKGGDRDRRGVAASCGGTRRRGPTD